MHTPAASLKTYYYLTKPGIVYGNTITAAAGFLLAAQGAVNPSLFLATLAGIALIIASACVFNNYLDRGLDQKMARTKKRALVTGAISNAQALAFASVLGLVGTAILALYTNPLALGVTLGGFLVYVVLYGISKRRSVHGTLVGSIAGAAPITAGYLAASGRLDLGALLVFLILALWQMPHFYAIGIYRRTDYAAAKLPVLPVSQGVPAAKRAILVYLSGFAAAALTLSVTGVTGLVYATIMTILCLIWLKLAVAGLGTTDNEVWARQMFKVSLRVLLAFSLLISLDAILI